ncbi:MAG: hypothetical protein KJ600_00410 [Nanoarchaeota archaeon]|nr:hypothetical protein [Nanoarchaeota archaeon]
MASLSYIIVISSFLLYYFLVLLSEKRIISEPKEIIEKFLAIALLYAGVSLIYFSITGKPFLTDDVAEYYIYIFIIGFIAVLWAIPNLLSEFKFFKKFANKKKK